MKPQYLITCGWPRILGTFIALVFGVSAFAQNSGQISGRVFNKDTGEYLQSALVHLKGTTLETNTDRTGYYVFRSLPAGEYVIDVNYPGLNALPVQVTLAAGAAVEQEIAVEEAEQVTLDTYTVREIAAGNALALSRQKASENIRNVLSVDAYGNVTDGNVGNMLRMIPGVTTSDADGDARFAIIRGLSPSLSTLSVNGLPVASAQADSSQQLDIHSTNNLSTIEVIKAPTPDKEHDAIGGSVNLVTRSAFDRKARLLDFTAGTGYMQMLGKWNKSFLMSWSDKFKDDRLGLTFSASYFDTSGGTQSVRQRFRYNRASDYGYNPNNNIYELDSVNLIDQRFTRERYSASSRIDFKLSEDFRVYADLGYSAYRDDRQNRNNQWNIGKNLITAQPFSDDGITTVSVPLNGMLVNTALGGFPYGTVRIGPVSSFIRLSVSDVKYATDLYNVGTGFVLDKKTHKLEGNAYYSRITGKEDWMVPIQVQMEGFQMEAVRAPDSYWPELTIKGQEITTLTPTLFAPSFIYRDPTNLANYTTQRTLDTNNQDNAEKLYGGSLDFTKNMTLANRPFAIKVGGKIRGKDKVNNANIERWKYTGGGTVLATLLDTEFEPEGPIYTHYSGLVQPPWPDIVKYNDLVRNDPTGKVTVDPTQTARNSILNDWTASEDVYSGYLMGSLRLSPKLLALGGLRYEKTDWATKGYGIRPRLPGDPGYDDDVKTIENPITGETIDLTQYTFFRQGASGSYDKLSPGVHLRYLLRPNIVLRAAYTETFSRPYYLLLIPRASIDQILKEINPGNPDLKAAEAQNYDLSAEFYLPSIGLFSIGAFRKDIDGFIFRSDLRLGNGADEIAQKNAYGVPSSMLNDTWTVHQVLNGEGARVEGFEIAYMQRLKFLPWHFDGLGVVANVTLLDSTSYVSTRGTESFPLVDQSDLSYNVGLTYEKFGFSGRVTVTSRGDYLTTVGSNVNEDIYSQRRDVWNFSASYRINSRWSVFADLLNFTDSPFRQYFGKKGNGYTNDYYGRTFNFGIKAKF